MSSIGNSNETTKYYTYAIRYRYILISIYIITS